MLKSDTDSDNPLIPMTRLDLAELPEKERFAVWKESISVLFDVNLEDKSHLQTFTSQLTTCHFGSVLFANSVSKAQQFQRSRRRTAQDGIDHILVQLYRQGRNAGICGKTSLNARPGDLILLDMGQTVDTQTDDYDNLTLVIPRQILSPFCKHPERLHGQVLSGDSLSGSVLRNHIETLWNNIDKVTAHEVQGITTGLVGLISAYFSGIPVPEELPEIQAARLEIIQNYIDTHLSSPDLTPHNLAARFYVSRARLYRLFAPLGGLASYIREQRLQRALVSLSHPANRNRYISEIAASVGFFDEAHFSRLFRRTFGISPTDARRCTLMERPITTLHGVHLDRSYEGWVRNLGY